MSPRLPLVLLAGLAVAAPAHAARTVYDHGTKVRIAKNKLTVKFTKDSNQTLMSHVFNREVLMGCADGDMKVLASREVVWKKQMSRTVRLQSAVEKTAHFCFVAKPEQVADGVLQGAIVMGFLQMPAPNV